MFTKSNTDLFEFKTKNFIVKFEAEEEHESLESLTSHMDESLAKQVIRGVQIGRLKCFSAKVSVEVRNTGEELASNYLGCCFYKDAKDFMDHFGHGISSLRRKLKRARKPERVAELQGQVAFFEKHGHSPIGSYFKDMVKTTIQEARKEFNQSYRQVTKRP